MSDGVSEDAGRGNQEDACPRMENAELVFPFAHIVIDDNRCCLRLWGCRRLETLGSCTAQLERRALAMTLVLMVELSAI